METEINEDSNLNEGIENEEILEPISSPSKTKVDDNPEENNDNNEINNNEEADVDDLDNNDSSSNRKKRKVNNNMYEDIEEMMFGFGDTSHWPPDNNSVQLIQSIVVNYIEDLALRASDIADVRSKDGKLDKECFMFVVRKDRSKFNRIYKLLKANEELKAVQKEEMKEDIAM